MPCLRVLLLSLLVLAVGQFSSPLPAAENTDFFEAKVRPILVEHCYRCHSGQSKKLRGGLRVDSRQALLTGGENGPALIPGQPEKSRLIEAVSYKDVELQMPPKGKLPEAAISDLTAWVRMGAPWPGKNAAEGTAPARAMFDLHERKQAHWAWQPIRPHNPPTVRNGTWPHDPCDRFILAKLEERGLSPAQAADRRMLLRRLSYDLIGLPPSPEETAAFLHDTSADAVEKVVDRLLASPHFGERWGRHWLDLVRYAETRGHEFDYAIPNAYHYRDYVVRAFNEDVPYNQFVLEHLAGDLLPRPRRHPQQGFNESILATGFWFLGEEVHSPVDIRQDQADRFDNKVDVLSKAFLGLTVACARCHDHKFDAISTKDYYALFGFLQSSHYRLARFDSLDHNRAVAQKLGNLRAKARSRIPRAIANALRPGAERAADYILAAREVLRTPASSAARLAEIAQAHKLDASVLALWLDHLKAAAEDEQDFLHALAQGASETAPRSGKDAAAKPSSGAIKPTQVIIDYAHCKETDWLSEGFAFGPGPVRAGELQLGGNVTKPTLHFSEYSAAEKDATWDVLTLAPGTQNDPGALGSVVRAGRTLRTPTFPLTTGKVYYLVKGSGFVYAAVGSHILIAGPLHGQLTRTINTGTQFQWIAHDLTPYQGQRIHLEFTPTGNAPFAISQVVESNEAPPRVSETRLSSLPTHETVSPESLAKASQQLLVDTLDALASDRLIGSPDAARHARVANWMVAHAALLGVPSPADNLVRECLVEQSKITERIQKESRLCVAMIDGSPENDYVHVRGSHKARGATIPRRFLEALAGPNPLLCSQGSGRLELAQQMIDPRVDPFLSRVLVNRVWHHLFGRGIVASTDNFGVLGERPTHPELLDFLADRFVQEGWSIKKLIRHLVLSSTYRMASESPPETDAADPEDLLLHRMRRRRLEGEIIRDAMLTLSGRLDGRLYGPSVGVHLTAFQEGRGRPASGPLDGDGRRSLYLSVRRNFLSPFLLAFDTPSPFSTVGRRTVSNVPAQSLILLNDPFVHQQAHLWARRMLAAPGSTRERIVRMYESAFTREPTETEVEACQDYLQHSPGVAATGSPSEAAWTDLAHVLFNVKDFIFVH